MNLNKDIQQLNNKLDLLRRKLDDAKARDNQGLILQFKRELGVVNKKIASIKGMQSRKNSAQSEQLKALNKPIWASLKSRCAAWWWFTP